MFTKDSANALGEAFRIYDNKTARLVSNLTVDGHLDVCVGASPSKIDSHSNQQGYTAVTELHSQPPWISKLEFITTHPTPRSSYSLKVQSILNLTLATKQLYIINH